MTSTRFALAAAMFLSGFLFPWWVGAIIGFVLALRYRAWEVVLFGALLDIMWLPSGAWYGAPVATCAALVLVWALEPLRRQFLFDYDE
jgi:hypothetical protein